MFHTTTMSMHAIKTLARKALWATSPEFYRKSVQPRAGQTFSIGIIEGTSPLDVSMPQINAKQVLSREDIHDVPATFIADPFMLRRDGKWFMFFEILNSIVRRGQIGLATSFDGQEWQYEQTILKEPFHLAYPFVFEWHGEVYMVPDTPEAGIRLYRCDRFPLQWVLVCELRSGGHFSDTTLLEHDGHWWMFSTWVEKRGDPETLRLYHAYAPTGPWLEHPQSPIVSNNASTQRAAGRPLRLNDKLFRFSQDCSQVYGECVHAIEITELTPEIYSEKMVCERLLGPGKAIWNQHGMHHIDAHYIKQGRWLACVDGWYMACTNEIS